MSVLGSPDTLVDFVVFYLLLAMCWVLGAYVRQRRTDEAGRRRLAAAAERARIARELHDVVTHHVTAMVIQADATQFQPNRQTASSPRSRRSARPAGGP